MTLRLRLLLYVTILSLALGTLAGVSLAALSGLNQKLATALTDYERLRWCYDTGLRVVRAREAALQGQTPPALVEDRLITALLTLDRPMQPAPDDALRKRVEIHLDQAVSAWRNAEDSQRRQAAIDQLHAAMNVLSGASQSVRHDIRAVELEAIVAQRRAKWTVGVLATLLIVGAVVIGWRHYYAVMRPVQQLCVASRRLASRDWRQRVLPCGDLELAGMARDFNHMADQLETLYRDLEEKVRTRSEQLVRAERLATVGVLAAGVAHEINNPLAIISGQAELALTRSPTRRLSQAMHEEALRLIVEETQRCKMITYKLLSLARPVPPQRRRVELQHIVIAAIDAMSGLATRKGCHLSVRESEIETVWVEADDMEIRQVLVNLLLNATDAAPDGEGRIEVTIGCDSHEAWVTVSDDGVGMDASTLGHIFEPFFTRRHSARPGQGLGLAVSHAIASSHGGSLTAESDGPDRGSRFTLRVPRCVIACEALP